MCYVARDAICHYGNCFQQLHIKIELSANIPSNLKKTLVGSDTRLTEYT